MDHGDPRSQRGDLIALGGVFGFVEDVGEAEADAVGVAAVAGVEEVARCLEDFAGAFEPDDGGVVGWGVPPFGGFLTPGDSGHSAALADEEAIGGEGAVFGGEWAERPIAMLVDGGGPVAIEFFRELAREGHAVGALDSVGGGGAHDAGFDGDGVGHVLAAEHEAVPWLVRCAG